MALRTLGTVKKERDRLYDDLDVNYQEACEIMRVFYAAGASINSLCKAWNTTDRRTIRRMLGDTLTVDPLAADKPVLARFIHVEPVEGDAAMLRAYVEQDNPVPPTAWVHEGRPTIPWWGDAVFAADGTYLDSATGVDGERDNTLFLEYKARGLTFDEMEDN